MKDFQQLEAVLFTNYFLEIPHQQYECGPSGNPGEAIDFRKKGDKLRKKERKA